VLLEATPLAYAPVVPRGFEAVARTIGAFGTTAPPRAHVVPEVGLGMNNVEPVALVCDPVPVPKSWVDVAAQNIGAAGLNVRALLFAKISLKIFGLFAYGRGLLSQASDESLLISNELLAEDAALLCAIYGNALRAMSTARAINGTGRNTRRAVCVRRLTLGG
jgi:hypothetical protein